MLFMSLPACLSRSRRCGGATEDGQQPAATFQTEIGDLPLGMDANIVDIVNKSLYMTEIDSKSLQMAEM